MDFDNFDELTARRLMAHMSPYDRETLTTAGVDKSFADGELEKGTKVGRAMQSPKKTAWQRMGAKEAEIDAREEVAKYKVERGRILDRPHEVKNISDKTVRYRPTKVKLSISGLLDLAKGEYTRTTRSTVKQRDNVPEVGSRFATSETETDVDGTITPGDKNLHTYDKSTKRLYGPQHDYRGTKVNEINTGDSDEESHKSLYELLDLTKALLAGIGRNPAKAAADLTQLRERALSKLGGVPATIKPITAARFQRPEEKEKVKHVNPRTGAPALATSNAGLDIARSVEITLEKAKETMASLDQARKNTEERLTSEKAKFTMATPPGPLENLSGTKGVDTTDEYKIHLSKARDFMESFKKSTSGTFGVRTIGKLTQDLIEEIYNFSS